MTYNALIKIIESGRFDKDDLLQKMDLFLLAARISTEQYEGLLIALGEDSPIA